jgi:hypothetical protein
MTAVRRIRLGGDTALAGCNEIIEFIGLKIRSLIRPIAYPVNSPQIWYVARYLGTATTASVVLPALAESKTLIILQLSSLILLADGYGFSGMLAAKNRRIVA